MANAIGGARQLYLTGKRRLLALPDALLQHAGEPLGKGTRIGRAVALEHTRFVEQEMHRIFLEARLLAASPASGGGWAYSMKIAALQQQLRIHRMLAAGEFRREQVAAAFAQPIIT